ncbi:MAG: alpha/beta fold hydrolase [Verrucomicrobia bacterium]|nr:alpha/beta fold hydrolase [Verrucomicrobiota bacterium]
MHTALRFLLTVFLFVHGTDLLAAQEPTSSSPGLDNLSREACSRFGEQFPFLAKVPRIRENPGDYVVLVHGFSWAKPPLRTLGRYLNQQGFQTIEIHYPIRNIPVDEVLDRYVMAAVQKHCTDPNRRIHFVGHSMGCIVIRKLLTERKLDRVGNVVLLAAPNKGTEYADFFCRSPLLAEMLGDFVQQVGVGPDSLPNRMGPVKFSPGIIMGTRSDFPFVPAMLPGSDDGVVTVASGQVEGMAELITLPTTHIRMPSTKSAQAQTAHFLRTGKFAPDQIPAPTPWLTF